jgi:tolkin
MFRCIYDYVQLRDGAGDDAPIIGSYCGYKPPKSLPMTTDNVLTIKFRSDPSSAGIGFLVMLTYGELHF